MDSADPSLPSIVAPSRYQRLLANHQCTRCGQPQDTQKSQCANCLRKVRERATARRACSVEKGLCSKCHLRPMLPHLVARSKLYHSFCQDCYFRRSATKTLGAARLWPVLAEQWRHQDHGRCSYTGERLLLGINASVDHIYPVCRWPERRLDPTNLEWVRLDINIMKSGRTRAEFLLLIHEMYAWHRYKPERREILLKELPGLLAELSLLAQLVLNRSDDPLGQGLLKPAG